MEFLPLWDKDIYTRRFFVLFKIHTFEIVHLAGCCWLTPVILATHEAEIRRIMVWSQPWQIVHKTLSQKIHHKKGLVEWLKLKIPVPHTHTKNCTPFWVAWKHLSPCSIQPGMWIILCPMYPWCACYIPVIHFSRFLCYEMVSHIDYCGIATLIFK
jgi:hypothetical protein